MKAKEKREKPKDLVVSHDGRHEFGWVILLGDMVVARYNDREQADAWCKQLNDRMQFRR